MSGWPACSRPAAGAHPMTPRGWSSGSAPTTRAGSPARSSTRRAGSAASGDTDALPCHGNPWRGRPQNRCTVRPECSRWSCTRPRSAGWPCSGWRRCGAWSGPGSSTSPGGPPWPARSWPGWPAGASWPPPGPPAAWPPSGSGCSPPPWVSGRCCCTPACRLAAGPAERPPRPGRAGPAHRGPVPGRDHGRAPARALVPGRPSALQPAHRRPGHLAGRRGGGRPGLGRPRRGQGQRRRPVALAAAGLPEPDGVPGRGAGAAVRADGVVHPGAGQGQLHPGRDRHVLPDGDHGPGGRVRGQGLLLPVLKGGSAMSSASEFPAEAGAAGDPPVAPGRFAGRTAIVTGAGSGIGRATAVRLAREGARVVAADLAADRLEQLAGEFPDLDVVPVAGDIATEEGVQTVVAAAGGRVDTLANVAGIMDSFLPPAEVDDATWERVFAVNVAAAMRLTRAVLPLMLEVGGGAIVNVSSEASLRASASGVAYTASKHAVNGLTKSTAVFYKGNGIRANAVAPGPVATNIEAPFKSQHAAGVLGPIMQTTIPPVATAEQLAATITWLLSDDASNVNGVILPSDGGWSAI